MIPTPQQEAKIAAVREAQQGLIDEVLKNARFHERQLKSGDPSIDVRYHVGAIDAYVATLKWIDHNTDWLSVIRQTA